MALQKSELLSADGTNFQILKAIVDPVLRLGGNDEDVKKVLKDKNLCQGIAKLIMAAKSFIKAKFKVVIDCTQTLKEMISAGKYDWVNSDITPEHFPITGKGISEEEVVLFHFDKTMTSEQVIAEMDKQGFKPASIEELLALGSSKPDLQKQFPIIALDSVWRNPNGRRCVPCLYYDGSRRKLDLDWFDFSWFPRYRFAAVRK